MKKEQSIPAQFEKNAQPTPPAPARDFERIANANALPSVGYAREFQNAEQRGRDIMEAGRRGERNFPPAKQVVKP